MKIEKNAAFLRNFIKEEIYLVQKERAVVPVASAPVQTGPVSDSNPPAAAAEPLAQGKLLVILKKDLQNLEPTQKDLLDKILLAIHADLKTTSFLAEEEYKKMPESITKYEQVVSFGVELPQVPVRYQPVKRNDQQYLVSDSLAALEQAIALKGKLWQAMKVMFST